MGKNVETTLTTEQQLIQKLRRIEALFAGTTYDGERDAAGGAMERIRERLRGAKASDPAIECKFTRLDMWSRRVLVALLRRYDIKPFRYHGQRRTTVMARMPASFMDETLWPEFQELDRTLSAYLNDVTSRVINEGIHSDSSEAEVRNQKVLAS